MIAGILLLMGLPFLPDRLDSNLMMAARFGDAPVLEVLLQAGAHPDARQSLTGWTALDGACFYGHSEIVRRLLAAGADPNTTDRHGGTPLMKAVAMPGGLDSGLTGRKVTIVKLLLAAGADAGKRDALGGTAWQTALVLGEEEIAEAFAASGVRGVREAQLMEAIAAGDEVRANELMRAGADVNLRDDAGWNALSEAALAGNVEITREVLSRGAMVNARFENGWTALMIAAQGSHPEVLRELLAAGADRALRSDDGATAQDIALMSGCRECTLILQAR